MAPQQAARDDCGQARLEKCEAMGAAGTLAAMMNAANIARPWPIAISRFEPAACAFVAGSVCREMIRNPGESPVHHGQDNKAVSAREDQRRHTAHSVYLAVGNDASSRRCACATKHRDRSLLVRDAPSAKLTQCL